MMFLRIAMDVITHSQGQPGHRALSARFPLNRPQRNSHCGRPMSQSCHQGTSGAPRFAYAGK